MKIYFQGYKGAYGNIASLKIGEMLNISPDDVIGLQSFKEVFDEIDKGNIGILPIENSYAGSIHENFYHIIKGNYRIIGELYLDIEHFLLSNTKDIKDIKEVYSHPQALLQCEKYLKNLQVNTIPFGDTAGSAKYVKELGKKDIASISSEFCSQIYSLNILDKNIEDQKGNTTRFFIVTNEEVYNNNAIKNALPKANKISIKFKTKHTPSALYKCLGAFATRFINLSKIESLPAGEDKFEYIFWLDFEKNVGDDEVSGALEELNFFCKELTILGDY